MEVRWSVMPRRPRLHAPGLLFHILIRGNHKQTIRLASTDYEFECQT